MVMRFQNLTWMTQNSVSYATKYKDEIRHEEVFTSQIDRHTLDAKQKELENWKLEEVYQEVDDVGQETISVRWVITPKLVNGIWTTKARLVARGFQESSDSLRKDSPTCMRETFRLVLAIATCMNWQINTVDIKAAFLQN